MSVKSRPKKRRAYRITAMVLAFFVVISLLPDSARAASMPSGADSAPLTLSGEAISSGQLLNMLEEYYALKFVVQSRRHWTDQHVMELLQAMEAFPPGMLERALDFFHMMSGSLPVVYLKQPSAQSPNTMGVTRLMGDFRISIDMLGTASVAETFAHELTHVYHFYLMNSSGFERLEKLYVTINNGVGYYGNDYLDFRIRKYIGEVFPTAYAMYSFNEDIAELFGIMCVDRETAAGYVAAGSGPLYEKTVNLADEFLRRSVSPAGGGIGDIGWWEATYGYTLSYPQIEPKLSEWARVQYKEAMTYNLLPPDSFLSDSPKSAITRLHFSYLAARLLEAQSGFTLNQIAKAGGVSELYSRFTGVQYDDVPSDVRTDVRINLYYLDQLDVMNGTGQRRFSPNMTLTRAQAAVLLTNVAKLYNLYAPPPAASYADGSSVPDWASDGVNFVTAAGIMKGTGSNRFSPNEAFTYEQALICTLNMYKWLNSQFMIDVAA